jgi:geranylgeranyl reductase family protein
VRHYDIVIAGAGPAGSATAILLARRGYSVLLLDRATFPRDKVCGDYLTPGAVQILRDELGVLPALIDAGATRVSRQTVVAHNGQAFGGAVDALACPRIILDSVLLDAARHAGASLEEGFSVRDILSDGDCVRGLAGVDKSGRRVEIRARVTVGADGTHSLLARRLGVVRPIPRLNRIGVSAYIEGGDDSLTMYLPIDRSSACCGVGPVFRHSGRCVANVSIGVPTSEASRIASGRDEYLRKRLAHSFPLAWERLRDSAVIGPVRTTGCFGHRTTRAAHDGAVLVGDAATFIHPFTGEGVYFALEGARLAANAIHRALQAGDTSYRLLSAYDRDRRRVLLPRYGFCDAVQHIVQSPYVLNWLAGRLAGSPLLTSSILRTLGDIDTVSDLLTLPNFRTLLTTSA